MRKTAPMPAPVKLSPAVKRALDEMHKATVAERYEDAEILCDGLVCMLGERGVSRVTVNNMLRLCLLRHENMGGCDHYTLNEDGMLLAADPNYQPRILPFLRKSLMLL